MIANINTSAILKISIGVENLSAVSILMDMPTLIPISRLASKRKVVSVD